MIQDIFLRGIVTALFVASAAECLFAIAAGRGTWTRIVEPLLHLIMSVAMVVMVWPWGMTLPTTGPMVFFLLAAAWFAGAGLTGAGHRVVNAYHAVMMLAMAWMYAVMSGDLLPGQGDARETTSSQSDMPGMEMPGMDTSSSDHENPAWIDAIDWLCTVGFAIAALWWLYRCFALRNAKATRPLLAAGRQTAMAAGMAITFAMML